MQETETFTPFTQDVTDNLYQSELKNVDTNLLLVKKDSFLNHIVNVTNNFLKLIRILSFICRFIFNCRHPQDKKIGQISLQEFTAARDIVLRHVQVASFAKELADLRA